jgi:hypothetical protein
LTVLEIHLDRQGWLPGETITGILLLQLARRTEVRSVDAQLYGHEHVEVTEEHGSGKNRHSTTYRESIPLVVQDLLAQATGEPLLHPGFYEPGTYTMPFAAPLPKGMPPSVSRSASDFRMAVAYDLHARLAVPWRFDPHRTETISVLQMPRPPQVQSMETAKDPTFGTGGTSIGARIEVAEVPRGGFIQGNVTVSTTGDKRLNGVRVELYETASGAARGHHGAAPSRTLSQLAFAQGQARFDTPLPFVLPVPVNASPSYEGTILGVKHGVRCTADMAWALNPSVTLAVAVS